MNAEMPENPSSALPMTTAGWDIDIDKIQITNDPKIWEEMSHLAWPTDSLMPMLFEAPKFREERIKGARECIKRNKDTQMTRKIEEEEGLHWKGDEDVEGRKRLVVDAMAVMDEMSKMDRNIKQDNYAKRSKTEKGLGKVSKSWIGMNRWSKWWKWCFGQKNRVVGYMS